MNLKKKFVVGAASVALIAGMGVAPAMAASDVHLPNGSAITRLDGADRVETALKAAIKTQKDLGAKAHKTAYIVGYNAVIDTATAGELTDGVILVAPRDSGGQMLLGNAMKDDTDLGKINKIVAIGGEGVVPNSVLDNIKKFNEKITKTDRLGGKNRYETAVAIAKHAFNTTKPSVVLLTSGTNPVDALAAGSVVNAVLLPVNTSGTVDASLPAYYDSLKVGSDNVIVLGGEGALADSQVKQVVGSRETVSPWEFVKTEAELKQAVKKAAIKYFGQGIWQNQATGLQPDPAKAGYGFFGLNAGDSSALEGTMVNAAKIVVPDTKGTSADVAKMFVGFKPSYENLDATVKKINVDVKVKQDAYDQELQKAKNDQETSKTSAWTCSADSNGAMTALTAPTYTMTNLESAYKALYGVEAVAATGAKGVCTPQGAKFVVSNFTSDNADKDSFAWGDDGSFAGENATVANKIAKDATNHAADRAVNRVAEASALPEGIAGSLNSLIALQAADLANYDTKKADVADADYKVGSKPGVNWKVLGKLANETLTNQKKAMDAAEEELKAAVAEYNTHPGHNTIVQAKGVKRIFGQDRYETSARVSFWSTTQRDTLNTPAGEVYLASGEDIHLIDSVVSGQLVKGSIVLVPTKGDLGETTKLELARLYKVSDASLKGFVMGGTGAVSDDTLKAVSAAMK